MAWAETVAQALPPTAQLLVVLVVSAARAVVVALLRPRPKQMQQLSLPQVVTVGMVARAVLPVWPVPPGRMDRTQPKVSLLVMPVKQASVAPQALAAIVVPALPVKLLLAIPQAIAKQAEMAVMVATVESAVTVALVARVVQ